MDRKAATRLFASAVLVAIVAAVPFTGDQDTAFSLDQSKAKAVADRQSAPIVLAQGRCFNGRCY